MNIRFTKKFVKQYSKISIKIRRAFDSRLKLFEKNSFYPLLNNHKLTEEYSRYRSINITGDWRAVFLELLEHKEKTITFVALGTHNQLYK